MYKLEVSKIYQKKLSEAIKLAISGDSLEVGKSILYYVKELFADESVKKDLGLDFDEIKINPGQHNAYEADITLLKRGKVVKKINAKTCVSGNLESTLHTLRKTKRYSEDGLIVFGLFCEKNSGKARRILGVFLISKEFLYYEDLSKILDTIDDKLRKKQEEENCRELAPYSLNQLVAVESLIAASRAAESVYEVKESVEKNAEKIEALSRSVQRLDDKVQRLDDKVQRLDDKLNKMDTKLESMAASLKNLASSIKREKKEKR